NGNFTAVKTAVDNNYQRIVAHDAQLAAMQAQLASPQLAALLALAPYLSLTTVNGQPAVRISGANLQIVNGTNETYTANGTGNLIIGYDEIRSSTFGAECSVGFDVDTTTPVRSQTECTAANGTWAVSHK